MALGKVLELLLVLAVIALLFYYAYNTQNKASSQTNKLSQGTSEALQTVDKISAVSFLNTLTFVWTEYKISGGSASVVSSSSGSWDDLQSLVSNLASQNLINPVVIYIDTKSPTLPVKSASFNLEPYKSVTSPLPFGYKPFYEVIKSNPNQNIYFVVGDGTDGKFQIVVQTIYVPTG